MGRGDLLLDQSEKIGRGGAWRGWKKGHAQKKEELKVRGKRIDHLTQKGVGAG